MSNRSHSQRRTFSSLNYVRGTSWLISVRLLGLDSYVRLQFLPLGSIVLSLLFFAFFKRLLGSAILASAMTLYMMMNPSQLGGVYSVFAYAAGTALYLGFILLFLRVQRTRRLPEILLLFAVAVAANAIHYAYTVWIILTALIMNAQIWVMRRSADGSQHARMPEYTIAFVLFVVVIFLGFSKVFYNAYLPVLGQADVLGGGWASFFHRLPLPASGRSLLSSILGIAEVSYWASYSRSALVSTLSTLNLLLILAPIGVGILLWLFRRIRHHKEDTDAAIEPVVWALLLTGVLGSAIYSIRVTSGNKYLPADLPGGDCAVPQADRRKAVGRVRAGRVGGFVIRETGC